MTRDHPHRRVLILCTGGTIGMQPGPSGLAPAGDFAARAEGVIAALPTARLDALPVRLFVEYDDPIDSSSARPAQWYRIAADIQGHVEERHSEQESAIDGVVVIHGTDTLAWCAASLAWQLADLPCPVVVTGAQRPLEAPGSDGPDNLEQALMAAAHPRLTGVSIAFGGQLLDARYARKWHTEDDVAFTTPNAEALGFWRGQWCLADDARPRQPSALPAPAAHLATPPGVKVVRLSLWPGIEASDVAGLLENADGAVLEAWGSGNLPEDDALAQTLRQAIETDTSIVVISQCPRGATHLDSYATGRALAATGVIDGGAMTPEAAFTRLHWLLASGYRGESLRYNFHS